MIDAFDVQLPKLEHFSLIGNKGLAVLKEFALRGCDTDASPKMFAFNLQTPILLNIPSYPLVFLLDSCSPNGFEIALTASRMIV